MLESVTSSNAQEAAHAGADFSCARFDIVKASAEGMMSAWIRADQQSGRCAGTFARHDRGYVKSIYSKLQVSNRSEVTLEAIRLGIIEAH